MAVNLPSPDAKTMRPPPTAPEKSAPLNKPDLMKKTASTGKTPRKQKSDRNIVSLDI